MLSFKISLFSFKFRFQLRIVGGKHVPINFFTINNLKNMFHLYRENFMKNYLYLPDRKLKIKKKTELNEIKYNLHIY